MLRILVILLVFIGFAFSQETATPLEKSGYRKLTTTQEIWEYLNHLSEVNKDFPKADTLGFSKIGTAIPFVRINSKHKTNKLKLMIFAQQHGNEPSGKEGLLLLLKNVAEGKLNKELKKLDITIIPQMNPDGGAKDKRMNGNGKDLNRDHSILETSEISLLHKYYSNYLPDVTLDIHEFYPYSKSWKEYGYLKNGDVQLGCLTNPNNDKIKVKMQKEDYLPKWKNFLKENGIKASEYIVGGPPNLERIRLSTYDIDDGRQSFGFQGSFSFIQEGRNGKDSIENIQNRCNTQYLGALFLIKYSYINSEKIKKIVDNDRKYLLSESTGKEKIFLQMEHVAEKDASGMEFMSYASGKDTIIKISNFHPADSIIKSGLLPKGYLVMKTDKQLLTLLKRHSVKWEEMNSEKLECEYDSIISYKKLVLEDMDLSIPNVEVKKELVDSGIYIFIPTTQLKKRTLFTLFESQSMFGLLQRENFRYLDRDGVFQIKKVRD